MYGVVQASISDPGRDGGQTLLKIGILLTLETSFEPMPTPIFDFEGAIDAPGCLLAKIEEFFDPGRGPS